MNLYLSSLKLNPRSHRVIKELSQPYEMHRTLMRAFPALEGGVDQKARNAYGVLFRAENDDYRQPVKLYVQSLVRPDWSFLDELTDYLHYSSGEISCDYKDVMPGYKQIHAGQVLIFRLRANPTKRVRKSDDPLKGHRVELTREDEQVEWLRRKGIMNSGFELIEPQLRVVNQGKLWGRKGGRSDGHTMTHYAVLFNGLLQVTDLDAFRQTLVSGIGTARAFGFGLLSVAPSNTALSEEQL